MSEAAARVNWLKPDENISNIEPAPDVVEVPRIETGAGWSPERFAREQIRRLVRQVFFGRGPIEVRQVVFSAVDAQTDVQMICTQVGEALAQETSSDVAVVGGIGEGGIRRGAPYSSSGNRSVEGMQLNQPVANTLRNLWFLPPREGRGWGSKASIKTYLNDIRREFHYSIVEAPPVTNCDEALSLGESADGLILVLSAKRTKRMAAFRIREMLAFAQVRLLGTVLSDREFPIPEKIYRRL